MSEEAFPDSRYPRFCQGGTYLVSGEAVRASLAVTADVPFVGPDDVLYSFLVARVINATVMSTPAFGYEVCIE